jgi:hypothetical protein
MSMVLKIFLKQPSPLRDIEIPIQNPDAFNFLGFVQAIEANGYAVNPNVYVRKEEISAIMYGDGARMQELYAGPAAHDKLN